MALEIKDGHIICGDDELCPFIMHPDHAQILAHPGMNVGIRKPNTFPLPYEGKYDLCIVESLLIQSQ